MFSLYLNHVMKQVQSIKCNWDTRYGHLSLGDLHTLQKKNMIADLPYFFSLKYTCEKCFLSK